MILTMCSDQIKGNIDRGMFVMHASTMLWWKMGKQRNRKRNLGSIQFWIFPIDKVFPTFTDSW